MRRCISVLTAGILMISLAACQRSVSERVSGQYRRLESYTVTTAVTVCGNKGSSVYEMKQYYRAPDSYRVELVKPEHLAGTISMMTGDKLWLRSGAALEEISEFAGAGKTDLLFPDGMLKEFLMQESLPVLAESADGTVLLTGAVSDGNRYRMNQNLILDGKNLLPKSLITYDEDGNEVLRADYRDFKKNVTIEDDMFLP